MDPEAQLDILIIGGGVTGLSLAHGLRKVGITSFRVFEKHNIERFHVFTRDWGVTLHWGFGLVPTVFEKSLIDKLPRAQTIPHFDYRGDEGVVVRNSKNGEVLKKIPLETARRLSHRKLVNVLSEDIDIEYGKELVNTTFTDEGVIAHFGDGTEAKGTIIVATDGGNSPMRRFLLGEEKSRITPLKLVVNNMSVKYPGDKAIEIRKNLTRFMDMGVHPEGTFTAVIPLDVLDESKPQDWLFQVFVTFPGTLKEEEKTPEARLRIMKERIKGYADPFCTAILAIPDGQYVPNDTLGYWESHPWDNHSGRVTVIGDAAHPYPPHRGQGVNNCLQDVHNLTEALLKVKAGQLSLSEAITAFDAEVRTRAQMENTLSVKQSVLMHRWDDLMSSPLMNMGAARAVPQKS